MVQKPPRNKSRWEDKLSRSGFFLGALLFHLVIFILIAGWIVFSPPPLEQAPQKVYIPTSAQPPVVLRTPIAPPGTPLVDNPSPPPSDQAIAVAFSSKTFNVSLPHLNVTLTDGPLHPAITAPVPTAPDGIDARLPAIRNFVGQYRKDDPKDTQGDWTKVVATFPVYIASYANGDWYCNTRLDKDGNIVAGSIPNLVAKINEWSHGKIIGQVVPKPLNIGSSELLDKKPPFIFFTGHKDFVLTDREIENLAEYLNDGGAIWGDNALAGAGSRFDVAFLREMKRVVPDKDKNFEPMSLTDDIFTKSCYHLDQVPLGMNYYAEAPQHLDIDGKLAIIYTPNDYSDMMFMRVLPGDKEVYIQDDVPPNTLYTDQGFWNNRDVFYRNFDLESALAVHRLGMNIVAYLLVRFDDLLLLGPDK